MNMGQNTVPKYYEMTFWESTRLKSPKAKNIPIRL